MTARAHWDVLAEAIEDAAAVVLDNPAVRSEPQQSEGVRYLTRFLAAASSFEMEPDPAYPHLTREFSSTRNWALPCPDGLYFYAALDGAHTYRLSGTRGTAHLLVVEVFRGGFFDVPHMSVFDSRTSFDVAPDGTLELVLSQEEHEGDWLRLPSGPCLVLIRQWFYDWDAEEQGSFTIERVGAEYPAPPVTAEDLAARRGRYGSFVRTSSEAFVRSAAQHYEAPADRVPFPQIMANVSAEEIADPYSMRGQVYGTGHYACGEGQAVILQVTPPDCEYWSFALFSQHWEVTDWLDRCTSINGNQAVIGSDGVFRAVISHRDPGVVNWLDAGHRELGLIGGRYFGATTVPEPTLKVIPFDALGQELPASTIRVSPEERQTQLAARARAMRRRFRP